jgi:hypothetical protein
VAARFAAALARAVPEVPESECMWRLYFAAGAMVHVVNWSGVIPALSKGLVDPSDTKALLARLIAFAAAGFRAPVPQLPIKEETHV